MGGFLASLVLHIGFMLINLSSQKITEESQAMFWLEVGLTTVTLLSIFLTFLALRCGPTRKKILGVVIVIALLSMIQPMIFFSLDSRSVDNNNSRVGQCDLIADSVFFFVLLSNFFACCSLYNLEIPTTESPTVQPFFNKPPYRYMGPIATNLGILSLHFGYLVVNTTLSWSKWTQYTAAMYVLEWILCAAALLEILALTACCIAEAQNCCFKNGDKYNSNVRDVTRIILYGLMVCSIIEAFLIPPTFITLDMMNFLNTEKQSRVDYCDFVLDGVLLFLHLSNAFACWKLSWAMEKDDIAKAEGKKRQEAGFGETDSFGIGLAPKYEGGSGSGIEFGV
jgi:hypothetical protein